MSTSLRTIVIGLGFATLGAVTVIGSQAIAQGRGQGPGYGQGYGQGYAHAQRARGGGMGPGQIQALLADLDLTEEQQAEAQELRAQLRELAGAHRPDRLSDREAIMEALEAEPVDGEAIHALIDQRLERQAEMQHAIADAALDFFVLLDSEQQAVVLDRAQRSSARVGRVRQAMQEPPAIDATE
jgi:Spy/CpxP family protein refolding chaperone